MAKLKATQIYGELTATGVANLNGGIAVDTDKFKVNTSGDTEIKGDLSIKNGDVINFTVDSATGDTEIKGDLKVLGDLYLGDNAGDDNDENDSVVIGGKTTIRGVDFEIIDHVTTGTPATYLSLNASNDNPDLTINVPITSKSLNLGESLSAQSGEFKVNPTDGTKTTYNFNVNDKFTVDKDTGNTIIYGTLSAGTVFSTGKTGIGIGASGNITTTTTNTAIHNGLYVSGTVSYAGTNSTLVSSGRLHVTTGGAQISGGLNVNDGASITGTTSVNTLKLGTGSKTITLSYDSDLGVLKFLF